MKFQMTRLWEDDTRPEPRFYNNVEQRPVRERPLPENLRERTVSDSRPDRKSEA